MLFSQRFWPGIADGSITTTIRRWKRPQVVAGRRYRTPAGMIEVQSVEEVKPAAISAADARQSGFASRAELFSALRGDDSLPLYRIRFTYSNAPDARAELAASALVSHDEFDSISARLARLDRASKTGPWTTAVLALIEQRPRTHAGDLAAMLGRDMPSFKLDVRKLKNLGLTISHEVGYELSPRGRAYVHAARTLSSRRDDG